jgi:hypothetical protein
MDCVVLSCLLITIINDLVMTVMEFSTIARATWLAIETQVLGN